MNSLAPKQFRMPVVAIGLFCLAVSLGRSDDQATEPTPLVRVNDHVITDADLEFLYVSRQVPENLQASVREAYLQELVERTLMREFLASRKVEVSDELLTQQVGRIQQQIRRNGAEPATVLSRLGYSDEKLREELSLPLAWNIYLRSLVTDEDLRAYWAKHREEFDGTEIHAAHILLKLPKDADKSAVERATISLKAIRDDIVSGKITFAEAAKKHSQAPSANEGGDLGMFPYRGKMPVVFSQHAFPLEKGAVSEPFRSPFGMHLITVTERKPGQLSLEDVREEVLQQRGNELWAEIVARQRAEAKIEPIKQ